MGVFEQLLKILAFRPATPGQLRLLRRALFVATLVIVAGLVVVGSGIIVAANQEIRRELGVRAFVRWTKAATEAEERGEPRLPTSEYDRFVREVFEDEEVVSEVEAEVRVEATIACLRLMWPWILTVVGLLFYRRWLGVGPLADPSHSLRRDPERPAERVPASDPTESDLDENGPATLLPEPDQSS